jgi:aspartate oxidase
VAREDWVPQEEPYLRRDPVTGQVKLFYRVRHDVDRSPKLLAHQACMREEMAGRHFRGDGARQDTVDVRAAFREATAVCKDRATLPSERS